MEKTRIFGAVVLTVSLMGVSAYQAQALQAEDLTVDLTSEEWSLAEATESAKDALVYVRKHTSDEYLGLEKYLERLIEYGEAEEVEDVAELVKAMDEVVEAVPLLLPEEAAEVKNASLTGSSTASAQNAATADVQAAGVSVTMDDGVVEEIAGNEAEEKADDEMEVPLTGEVRKAGFGEFLLAGIIVVLGTVTATLVVLRSKK